MAKLPELCEIQYGYAFDSACFTEDNTHLPLVRIRDVKRGYSETFYSGNYPGDYVIDSGSLLVGMDGEFNIARWKGGHALLNQRVCKITAKENVNEEYIRFALSKALKEIENRTAFVTVKHLSAKELNQLEIDVPDYTTQTDIAKVLTQIESIISARQQQLQKLDELVKARFVELFGTCAKLKRLEEYASLITKGASPKWQGVDYCEEGVLFVTSENVREGYLDFSKRKYLDDKINEIQPRSMLKRNDILINIVGASIGRAAVYNCDEIANINQAVALVRVDYSRINQTYLMTYLNSAQAIEMYGKIKKGGARDNLSLQNIADLQIPVASMELQEQFAAFVKQTDKSKVAVQKALDEAQLLFDSLMQKYFG